jgi:hypothetical protein
MRADGGISFGDLCRSNMLLACSKGQFPMQIGKFHSVVWAIVATTVSLVGCGGSDLKLTDVSGKATFGGKAIGYGLIEFFPDTAKGHKGPAGSAEIVDGQYDTRKAGRGIVPGPHHVRITGYDQRPAPAPADETQPYEATPALFAGYTTEADLTEATKDFEVPEAAKNAAKPQARRALNEP